MQTFWDYLQLVILFGLLSVFSLWVARGQGFFILPNREVLKKYRMGFKSVFVLFAIYLLMTMVVAPLLVVFAQSIYRHLATDNLPMAVLGWIQLLSLLGIFLLFFLYAKGCDPELFRRVWKDHTLANRKSILTDFLMGIMTWFIALPVVLAIGQIADMFLYYVFQFESYEQVAVRYLKETLQSPPLMVIALFMILIAAPIIEEFLFRGCLQTFFKRYMTRPKAILLSSACFALFHFASSQGLGNVSLILSLFTFALFLGFIYERQASLFASIGLHMTFNAVSTVRILFFPDAG